MIPYVVYLDESVGVERREAIADRAAAGLGLSVPKVIRLLSRRPGPVTRPVSRYEAERVAMHLRSAGAPVRAMPVVSDEPHPAPTTPRADPPAGASAAETDAAAFLTAERDPPQESSWDGVFSAPSQATWSAPPGSALAGLRISWRGLLLVAMLPLILLGAVGGYLGYRTVLQESEMLLTQIADNLALSVAADFSTYLTEQDIDLTDSDSVAFFGRQLRILRSAQERLTGVHYTDARGQVIATTWQPQDAEQERFEAAYAGLALDTLEHSEFGNVSDPAERSTLLTSDAGTFMITAAPLIGESGTVQVVLEVSLARAVATRTLRTYVGVALMMVGLVAVWVWLIRRVSR